MSRFSFRCNNNPDESNKPRGRRWFSTIRLPGARTKQDTDVSPRSSVPLVSGAQADPTPSPSSYRAPLQPVQRRASLSNAFHTVKAKCSRDKLPGNDENCESGRASRRTSHSGINKQMISGPIHAAPMTMANDPPPKLDVLSEIPQDGLHRSSTFRTCLEKAVEDINQKYGSTSVVKEIPRVSDPKSAPRHDIALSKEMVRDAARFQSTTGNIQALSLRLSGPQRHDIALQLKVISTEVSPSQQQPQKDRKDVFKPASSNLISGKIDTKGKGKAVSSSDFETAEYLQSKAAQQDTPDQAAASSHCGKTATEASSEAVLKAAEETPIPASPIPDTEPTTETQPSTASSTILQRPQNSQRSSNLREQRAPSVSELVNKFRRMESPPSIFHREAVGAGLSRSRAVDPCRSHFSDDSDDDDGPGRAADDEPRASRTVPRRKRIMISTDASGDSLRIERFHGDDGRDDSP
ncbi:Mss4-like protein [Ophiocordyceps camponoti-floridani]|uniref:Mss4-like protein n=1 Tax=Ophiocordyceps camponoti-floridani TaxID=2030778 RepID=A0A8H4Q448_9HYPO|nr:Mss4-like protein [Ophiocordyceps camponoti-floridani]